jgi:hypothetical protein
MFLVGSWSPAPSVGPGARVPAQVDHLLALDSELMADPGVVPGAFPVLGELVDWQSLEHRRDLSDGGDSSSGKRPTTPCPGIAQVEQQSGPLARGGERISVHNRSR